MNRPSSNQPILSAQNLHVHLGGELILHGVDLEIRPAEIHGLIGPNGAGKSTLLRSLAQLTRVSSGLVYGPEGGDVAKLTSRQRAKVVGYLPQDTSVDMDFHTRDVVAMGRYAHIPRWRQPGPEDERIVDEALHRAGVAHLARRSARSLSGGQRQLVLLAKQLAQRPSVYLLDEPVSALDLAHQLEVMKLMGSLAADQHSVVAVLHDITLASRVCHRITVLDRGHVHTTGTPDQVLTAQMLAEVYQVEARVQPGPLGELTVTPVRPLHESRHAPPQNPLTQRSTYDTVHAADSHQ